MKFHKKKPTLISLALALSLLAPAALAESTIRLEKELPKAALIATPSELTFRLYDSDEGGEPVASQSFGGGQWSSQIFSELDGVGEMVRFRVDFSETDSLSDDMVLWLEVELDGVVYGARERVQGVARSLFSGSEKDALPLFTSESGKVGIGTDTPEHALDVAGTINASESGRVAG